MILGLPWMTEEGREEEILSSRNIVGFCHHTDFDEREMKVGHCGDDDDKLI